MQRLQSVKEPPNRQNADAILVWNSFLAPPHLCGGWLLTAAEGECKSACYARHFDLLRNSPLSSIHIRFGGELLVFGASLTSASLQKQVF